MKRRILLIGPFPPPPGGVSVHLTRLTGLLIDDFELDYVDESHLRKSAYFNLRSLNIFKYIKKILKADLIFIQSGTNSLRVVHLIFGQIFSKKTILTLHAYPNKKGRAKKRIDEVLYRTADKIIIVNAYMLNHISIPADKYIVKNAFIPPLLEKEPDLPEFLKVWIESLKSKGYFIACANAYRLDIYNNQDLYGLDMCFEAAGRLLKRDYNIGFVFNVSTLEKSLHLYKKYKTLIKESGLEETFLLINENLSFVNLMRESDIVLRPTNLDGDALTIREALYLHKPVIASDVVTRPEGTTLFRSRDIIDFENKLAETIDTNLKMPGKIPNEGMENYKLFYVKLIEETLSKTAVSNA